MKHRTGITAASLGVSLILGAAPAAHAAVHGGGPDADSDHRPCVSSHEFNRINPGDSKTYVKRVFDTRGTEMRRRDAGHIYRDLAYYGVDLERLPMRYREVRSYPACTDRYKVMSGTVSAVYDRRGHELVLAEMDTMGMGNNARHAARESIAVR